jgi:hypothetical protein
MEGKGREKELTHPTTFHELVKSDLSPQGKTVRQLNDEAQLVVAAGQVTTGLGVERHKLPQYQPTQNLPKIEK